MTASEFLQALATGSAIIDTDNVVVYSSGGEALKIPAKVVKAYLINGITPQFRNQGSGIEMSVDGGTTWDVLVTTTELGLDVTKLTAEQLASIKLQFSDLTDAEKSSLKGAKGDTGATGATGPTGPKGDTGATGNGIASISKTSTSDLVDTYTITYTDGTTKTYTVTNGAGLEFTWAGTQLGVRVHGNTTYTYVDLKGATGATGATGNTGATGATGNGISNVAKTSTSGLVDTYTITLTDSTTKTFTVTNGSTWSIGSDLYWYKDGVKTAYYSKGDTGATGAQGIQGIQGVKGDTGAQGIQGVKGDKGDTGNTGSTGATGAAGRDAYSPKIQGGIWYVWNDTTQAYESTGVSASSDYVLTKAAVEDVLTGDITSHNHDAEYLGKTAKASSATTSDSCSGNSATATKLANARTVTIGAKSNIFDGSGNISYALADIGAAPTSHTHTKSQITDFPTSMPASDVSAWAKAASKPNYSYSEITGTPADRSGVNTVNSLASLPVDKDVIYATLSAATDISLSSALAVGKSITIVCLPSAGFTQPLPTSGGFTSMDGDSLTFTSGKLAEISILCYANGLYSISSKVAS